MWCLFEEKSGWCVVHEKNAIKAGSLQEGDVSKYFYQGKEYEGKVLMMNKSNDAINDEMKRLTKEAKAKSKAKGLQAAADNAPVLGKRKAMQTSHFVPEGNNKPKKLPKVSEEEKNRRRILDLNLKESQMRANAHLLSKVLDKKKPSKDDDDEWTPPIENECSDKDTGNADFLHESDCSDLEDFVQHSCARKVERQNILRTIKTTHSSEPSDGSSKSPTVEELMEQNRILQMKLQLAYDQVNDKEKKSAGEQILTIKETPGKGPQKKSLSDNTENGDDSSQKNSETDGHSSSFVGNHDNCDSSFHDEDSVKQKDTSQKKGNRSAESNQAEDENSNDDDYLDTLLSTDRLSHQLYGQGDDMDCIGQGIFCKKKIISEVIVSANSHNSVVRRLMPGVFIPSQILNCTQTGQSWHAGGPAHLQEKKEPLHPGALRAIVAFANRVARKKGWSTRKFHKCAAQIRGKLVEMKQQFKKGSLKD